MNFVLIECKCNRNINLQGDHGQVESKFDIPVCTACGSTDQIVVETSDAAHACIKKLRESNVGRVTFSILPQVQKLKSYADMKKN